MQSTYLLLPVGTGVFLLYLISWLLVKTGFQSRLLHRRIWNVILLTVFSVTAILGLLLVIQINFKLEWPFVRTMLKWHVDFGIAMSLVALIHLIERFPFYIRLFKSGMKVERLLPEEPGEIAGPVKRFPAIMVLSGFLSTVVQVLYIREITTLFQGNELMMGWTLGAWMLLTGAGAFVGSRRLKRMNVSKSLFLLIFLLSVFPFLMILFAGIVKPLLFPPGILTGPVTFFLVILLILAPVALLCGYAYALLVRFNQKAEKDYIKVYVLESIGSLAGGIVVSFILIQWFSIFQSLLILSLLSFLILFLHEKRGRSGVGILVSFALLLIFCFSKLELGIRSLQYANQEVVETRETIYGNLTVTRNGGQYNFFESGSLLFTTNDVVGIEEAVHYAMLQSQEPETVLLISGSAMGMANEILKYPSVKRIDNIEQDKTLIELAGQYRDLSSDQRINRIYTDGLNFLKKTSLKYDVAIVAVPGPSSLQYNRFYTASFFKLLKKRMNKDGIVSIGIASSGNYLMSETVKTDGPVFRALKMNYANVEVITGEKDYFVASDVPLSTAIAKLSSEKDIPAVYVNPNYIDDLSLILRGKQLKEELEMEIQANTDEQPAPVFYHTLRYIGQFSKSKLFVLLIPVLLLIIPLFFMTPVSGGMYITGFTASSVEVLLLFLFQVVFGYLYSALGVIIALFMGGLVLGGLIGKRINTGRVHFLGAQTMLGIFALLFPVFWMVQKMVLSGVLGWVFFMVITLIPAVLTGFLYVDSTQIYKGDRSRGASVIYSADLLGGALGAVLATLVLIPFLGIRNSCFVLAAANGVVVVINILKRELNIN